MAATWTLPAADIITDALQIVGVIGAGKLRRMMTILYA
jgi:hypothetical protein